MNNKRTAPFLFALTIGVSLLPTISSAQVIQISNTTATAELVASFPGTTIDEPVGQGGFPGSGVPQDGIFFRHRAR